MLVNMKTSKCEMNNWKNIESIAVSNINTFLKETVCTFSRVQIQIDFSKEQYVAKCLRLFTDNGLVEMLKASDFDRIDKVSPSLWEHRWCVLWKRNSVKLQTYSLVSASLWKLSSKVIGTRWGQTWIWVRYVDA